MRHMTITYLALLAIFVCGAAVTTRAQQPDPKTVAEIKEMLEKHDKALNEKNLQALMETFAPGPNTVVMGTGPGERWVGADEIRQAYTEIFKDFDAGTLQVTTTWRTGNAEGNVAWISAQCHCVQFMKNEKREYALNVSGTLVKRDGQWKIVALHMSNPTAPE
jgi:uncharacterized protein (TIGR02246 family)